MINGLHDYKAEEHEVEIAQEGENLVMELFKQYINSTMRGYMKLTGTTTVVSVTVA